MRSLRRRARRCDSYGYRGGVSTAVETSRNRRRDETRPAARDQQEGLNDTHGSRRARIAALGTMAERSFLSLSVSQSLSLSVSLSPVSGTLYTTTLHIPGKFLSRNCTTSPPETTSSASDDRHNPIRELDRTPCPRRRVAEALTLGAVCLNSALYHAECSDASDRDETEAGGVGRVRCPPIRSNISTRARMSHGALWNVENPRPLWPTVNASP